MFATRNTLALLLLALFAAGFGESRTLHAQTAIEISAKGGYAEKKLLKAPKRAYIHRFNVYFQTLAYGAATSRARSIGNTRIGKTKTEMLVALDGLTTADLQAATDQVYGEFVADLRAQGYEIVDASTAQGSSELLADWTLLNGGGVSTAQLEGYARVTPTGYDYLVPKVKKGGKEKGTFIMKDPKISGQLDDAVVISVDFVFPFAEIGAANTFLPGRSKVKAETSFRLAQYVGAYSQETNILGEQKDGGSATTAITFTSGKGAGATARAFMSNKPKKDVALPGVIDAKKFKEATYADTENLSAYAWYQTVTVSDLERRATHVIPVESGAYREAVTRVMKSFSDAAMARLKAGK